MVFSVYGFDLAAVPGNVLQVKESRDKILISPR